MSIPIHIGIIVDGNRRWAKKRHLPSFYGHKFGLENLKRIGRYCQKRGIKILTVFAFSTENWQRSKKEVSYLMKLLESAPSSPEYIRELIEREVKVNIIGQRERLPQKLQSKIKEIERLTKNNKKAVFNIALSYGGRAEIVEAVKNILAKKINPEKIDENTISKNLGTKDLPDPDLIIRTGKRKRISNFLLWQSAYSELYFSDKLWPDFTEKDLDKAIREFSLRKRTYGR